MAKASPIKTVVDRTMLLTPYNLRTKTSHLFSLSKICSNFPKHLHNSISTICCTTMHLLTLKCSTFFQRCGVSRSNPSLQDSGIKQPTAPYTGPQQSSPLTLLLCFVFDNKQMITGRISFEKFLNTYIYQPKIVI